MTNEVQIFHNSEFGEIRTVTEDNGMVFFCGRDVAAALGYARPNEAVSDHCRGTLKRRIGVKTGQKADGTDAIQNIEMLFISEGDLYRLICNSKLPSAEKFERWVFDEVLPAIRKHGGYLTQEKIAEALLNPDTIIKLASALKAEQKKVAKLTKEIEEAQPKVFFADSVSTSNTDILIGDLAKFLKQNGMDMGQKRLFTWLRDNDFLIKQKGNSWNMPTQRAMNMGLFRVKETATGNADGSVTITRTTKVTGKGQIYFINKFLGRKHASQVSGKLVDLY